MKVKFSVDFKIDCVCLIECLIGIISQKAPVRIYLPSHLKKRMVKEFKKNVKNKISIPDEISRKYYPIWMNVNKELNSKRNKLVRVWRRIEKSFFCKLSRFMGMKVKKQIVCYIVYSYQNFASFEVSTNSVFLGLKAADVYTLAHEIIHIYLRHKVKKIIPIEEEVITRIIEYKLLPEKKLKFIPHWLDGLSIKEFELLLKFWKSGIDYKNFTELWNKIKVLNK